MHLQYVTVKEEIKREFGLFNLVQESVLEKAAERKEWEKAGVEERD